jgi:DNA-binding SARP family transcriptional activator
MTLTRTLPRLAPSTVRRPRLERWLATHAGIPVRLLIAPSGSGKTTLLLKYVPESAIAAGYCALPPGCGPAALFQAIASALALPRVPRSHDDMLALLQTLEGAVELVVDDADNAAPEANALLHRLVEDAPDTVSFIYASRARDTLDAKTWIARGLAVLCDWRKLAFDTAETQLLAEACGVSHTGVDVSRLIEESDGWAIVLSGAVRCAAEDARSLGGAFENWRTRYGQMFTEFIAAELDRAEEEDRASLRGIMAGALPDDEDRLQRLEAQGLFVIDDAGGCRPLRPIRHLRGGRARSPQTQLAPMSARMFGHFEVRIGGTEIAWIRKRDQQIVKYLLLKPSASATRTELASIFWPEADRQLAAQSVRTACSNIRKAIAAITGYAVVERYFRADPDVALELSQVAADVRRFGSHVADGDGAFDRGDLEEAGARYRAAEELYAGRLLDADAPEAWFAAHAQLLEDRYVIVLERLAQLAFDEGDMKGAADYAYRVQQLRPDSEGLVRMLGKVAPQYRIPTAPASLEERRRNKRDSA